MERSEIETMLKSFQKENEMKGNMKFFNKETIVYAIAVIVTLIWGFSTLFLIGKALKLVGKDADLTAVLSVYSTITATFMVVLNFYFGSTKNSQEKTEQINKMINEKVAA